MNLNDQTEYLYYLPNASLTLRVIQYLHGKPELAVLCVTIVHQIDGWLVRIKFKGHLTSQDNGDFRAYLNELGISYDPPRRLQIAFMSLEMGECPINLMRRYQIAIVSHGNPNLKEIEAFREQFVKKLGYCPETLV